MNEETQPTEAPALKGKRAPKVKQAESAPAAEPEAQLSADVEKVIGEVAEIATIGPAEVPAEAPLSSLSKDELIALCGKLNAQIIAIHDEGKHLEGDALRVKHLNALAALRCASNPTGYA